MEALELGDEIIVMRDGEVSARFDVAYDELVDDAIRCWDAGASAIHQHNSSFDLLGEAAALDYMPVWDRVLKARPEVI